jgi:vitamin B12 transporter
MRLTIYIKDWVVSHPNPDSYREGGARRRRSRGAVCQHPKEPSLQVPSRDFLFKPSKFLALTIVLLLLVTLKLTAGNTIPDTITVNTVTVTAMNHTRELPFSFHIVDSSLIASERSSDIGRLLQYSSPVIVKRYGTDGLSSLSLRGMSGTHTSVIWNGIEINAPLNGQTDFTLLPVFAVDKIQINSGGANLSGISGTIGGALVFSSDEMAVDGIALKCFTGGGNYGKNNAGVSFSAGNVKVESTTKLWFRNAENNFPFVNENAPGGPETLRRVNASSHMRGAMQDVSVSGQRQHFSAHLWFSDANRQLPSAVNTVQQDLGEKQQDMSIRAVLNYRYIGEKVKTEVITGYINELNIYDYQLAGVHGNNRSETYTLRSSFRLPTTDRFRFTLYIGDELQKATSLSFVKTHLRNMLSASAVSDFNLNERLLLQAQVRDIAVSGEKSVPEVTVGASFKTDRTGADILKANFSRNVKYPSLNDLYWSPGGNTGLKPEVSTGAEIAFSHSGERKKTVYSDYSVALFDARVNDLIQWAPGSFSFWEAQNLKSVNNGGVEVSATTFYNPGSARLKIMTSYALTRSVITGSDVANDASVGGQLIYTPYHVINAVVTGEYGIFRLQSSLLFNSKRYTVSDDSEYLKGYMVSDVSAGAVLKSKNTTFNIDISVDNLFSAAYESTKGYPMPLRTFMIDLLLTLNPKSYK